MSEMVAGRKVCLDELWKMADGAKYDLYDAAQSINRDIMLYLHWTAGHYHQFYDGYHINIDDDGSIYVTTDDLAEVLAHTWHRNTGAIGISLACCAFCDTSSLGDEPPTDEQIESMAKVICVLCNALELSIDAEHVLTHAEAADLDEYGPATTCERWDLWFLCDGDKPGSGGNVLREKAICYQQNGRID